MSLPPLLLSLMAGFVLSSFVEPGSPLFVGGCSGLLLVVAAFSPRRWQLPPACAGMLLLALLLVGVEMEPPASAHALHRFAGPEGVSVTGELISIGRSSSGSLYYDLEVEELARFRFRTPLEGKMRLYLDEVQADFEVGDRICFMTRLRRPRLFGTPGEFDAVRYLARRDIFTVASVKSARDIARFAERRDATFLERWRRDNAALIGAALAGRPELAGLMRALAQGERLDIPAASRELLSAGGLSHLFAISGLHFGLVAAALYGISTWLWRRSSALLECCPPRRVLPLLLIPALYGYLCFSGAAISSWRAFLLLAAGALVMVSLRRVSPVRALAAVALVLLLGDPLLFFEAGFQLSFAATLAIMLVMRRCYPALRKQAWWQRYPLVVFLVTLTATVSTFPLVLLHFQIYAPAGLLANLLAVPTVSFLVLPLALAGSVLGLFWPAAAESCFYFGGFLLDRLLCWAAQLLDWPGMSQQFWATTPEDWLLVALTVVGLFLVVGGRRRLLPLVLVAAILLPLPWEERPALAVTALSVGQGESLLVRFDGRHAVLVDAGGFAGSSFDVGARLVVPALARMGLERLDAIVLTHAHPDHLLGLGAVLEKFPVDRLCTRVARWKLPAEVARLVERGELELVTPEHGWHTLPVGGHELQVFAPDVEAGSNDRSLAVYARCENQGVLLTGDLEKNGVRALLAEPPSGPVTLLKLPHHGSRYSAPKELLGSFSPRQALVSVGRGNRYRFPHSETVRLYEQARVPLWRTDFHGTLRATTDGGEWRVTQWKKGGFR